MRGDAHKTARLSWREQRRHAQSRDPHRLRHYFLQRRRQLGPDCFCFPRPNGCCAVRRAHLALRDTTSSLPFLARLHMPRLHLPLNLPRSQNLVSGWIKCHLRRRTSTCGKLSKCPKLKHLVMVPGSPGGALAVLWKLSSNMVLDSAALYLYSRFFRHTECPHPPTDNLPIELPLVPCRTIPRNVTPYYSSPLSPPSM